MGLFPGIEAEPAFDFGAAAEQLERERLRPELVVDAEIGNFGRRQIHFAAQHRTRVGEVEAGGFGFDLEPGAAQVGLFGAHHPELEIVESGQQTCGSVASPSPPLDRGLDCAASPTPITQITELEVCFGHCEAAAVQHPALFEGQMGFQATTAAQSDRRPAQIVVERGKIAVRRDQIEARFEVTRKLEQRGTAGQERQQRTFEAARFDAHQLAPFNFDLAGGQLEHQLRQLDAAPQAQHHRPGELSARGFCKIAEPFDPDFLHIREFEFFDVDRPGLFARPLRLGHTFETLDGR